MTSTYSSAKYLMKLPLVCVSFLFLSGCFSSQLDQQDVFSVLAPEVLPERFGTGVMENPGQADTSVDAPITRWLESFGSPELNLLVKGAIDNNHSLAQQALLVKLAEQNVRISKASLFPTLNLSLNAQRADSGTVQASDYDLALVAGYELDLWGKLNANQKQSTLNLASQKASYQLAERTLVRDVVNASVDTSTATQLLGLLSQRAQNLTESLDVIQRGYRSGLNSALDVYLSRNTLEQERAGIANQQQLKFEAQTRLELLLGEYPAGAISIAGGPMVLPTEPLSPGIPSELLLRRPDIQQAWLNLMAADAGVAIAHKNRFPSLNLSASLTDSDEDLGQLLSGGSLAWSLSASLLQPLFQGGRLAALEMQAKIVLEQQERRYLELVYLAFSEVEVELNRKQALSDRYDAFVRAEQNATAALELGLDQYQRGLVDYTTVLEAQRRAFDAQTTLIELRNQQLKNRVNLLLALGGDY